MNDLPRSDASMVHEQERKFVAPRADVERFLSEVMPHLTHEVRDPARPLVYVRTTYLDTDVLDYLRSELGPVKRRLRVREYASAANIDDPPRLTGAAAFEVKEYDPPHRMKTRVPLPPQALLRALLALRSQRTASVLEDEAPDMEPRMRELLRERLAMKTLAPRLTTFCRRMTFSGGPVRVTLDEGILFGMPVPPGEPGDLAEPTRIFNRGPSRVLEVKTVGDPPAWLETAMSRMDAVPAFSKFRAGMQALAEGARKRRTRTLPILPPLDESGRQQP